MRSKINTMIATLLVAAGALVSQLSFALDDAGRDKVVLGDERFEEYFPLLEGKRVAVFSNQTGIVGDKVSGSKLADALSEYGGCFPEGNRSLAPASCSQNSYARSLSLSKRTNQPKHTHHCPDTELVEVSGRPDNHSLDEISLIPFLEPSEDRKSVV